MWFTFIVHGCHRIFTICFPPYLSSDKYNFLFREKYFQRTNMDIGETVGSGDMMLWGKTQIQKNTNTNINTDIDIGEAVGSEDMMLWGLSSPMTRGGSRDQSALLCPKGKMKATIEGWIIASSGLMCFSLNHGMQPYFARALFFTQCAMHSFCTKGFLRIW